MIDKEQVSIMLKDVERYFSDLNLIHLENRKELEIPEKRYAISMLIFSIMNRIIDISNEVLIGSSLQVPGTYKDSFEILANAKIISYPTSEKMINLAKFRNIIAHEYYRLSNEELYSLKKKIFDVEKFLEEIRRHLK